MGAERKDKEKGWSRRREGRKKERGKLVRKERGKRGLPGKGKAVEEIGRKIGVKRLKGNCKKLNFLWVRVSARLALDLPSSSMACTK